MTEETAHSLLQRRRRELEAQISALKGQLAPKETELAQIDKMLAAAGPPPPSVAPALPQRNSNAMLEGGYAAALLPFLDPKTAEALTSSFTISGEALEKAKAALAQWDADKLGQAEAFRKALASVEGLFNQKSKFAAMTIKELVVQAIIDHFPKGGKVSDIREFIRNGYGRDIDQASLRPQMHRLKADRILTQAAEIWNLDPQKRSVYAMYNHPTSRAAMKELKDEPPEANARRRVAEGLAAIEPDESTQENE